MQSTASKHTTQSDNINIMQPQPTPNMYVPNNGAANGSNARSNQSGLFRGTPTGNPSARAQTRQIPMQNMYPQPMHHGVVVSTFAQPYGARQPPFQTQQTFQYPHSTMPSNYFFQPLFMQQPPQHRGPMNVNASVPGSMTVPGPNVQLTGPPGSTQAQIPLAPTQVIPGGVPPGAGVLGVGPTAAQVGSPQIGCLVPGSIPSHPQQSLKQPKSHPNRLKIIDPNTFKNILDDLEPPKSSTTNIEADYQEQQQQQQQTIPTAQADYTIATGQTNEHPGIVDMSSEILIMPPETRPNLTYNVRYDSDAQQHQQIQEQRDTMISQTPVVSAMSDAPSIEIPNRKGSKKIPIIAPKTDNLSKQPSGTSDEHFKAAEPTSVITFDSNSNIDSTDTQVVAAAAAASNNWNDNNNYENIDVVTTSSGGAVAVQQAAEPSPPPPTNQQQQTNSNLETTVTSAVISSAQNPEQAASNLDIKSELYVQSNEVNNDNMKMKKDNNTTTTTTAYEEINQITNSAAATAAAELLTASSNVSEETTTTTIANQNELETTNDATTTATTTETENNNTAAVTTTTTQNVEGTQESRPSLDETDRVALNLESSHTQLEKESSSPSLAKQTPPKESETTTPVETAPSTSKSESNLEPESNDDSQTAAAEQPPVSQQLQSLITYDDGQWSPNNPSGKKQYNKKQLLQLREAQSSQIQPAIKNTSILPQKSLMPSFSKHNNNASKSMMMGSIGGNRNSNYGGNKPSSISGVYSRNQSSKGEKIKLNLSLNQDVKLNETDNAWRPRVLLKNGESEVDPQTKAQEEKEELIRKVRGILNKLTPEKFDTLVEEIIKLKIDTADKMEDVMVLVFEKAIDEPNFSVSYARLCHRLISEVKARNERMENDTKTNLALFRNALLDKTEYEFVQNVTGTAAKEAKLKPITEKIKNCTDPNEKIELEALLEEEERKLRRRSVGTVRFIGELFKISMLTGKIVNQCIETLLKNNNEDMLECLCKLLTTVGAKFEQTPMQKEKGFYSLDKTIARMQAIASKTDKEAKVSSRVRFMLQDVIDLRKKNWEQTRNEAPATMQQIEKETKNAQLTSQYLNYTGSISTSGAVNSNSSSQMGGSNNKRDDRGNNRFNDSRSGYGGSHSQRGESGSMRRQQGGSGSGNSGGGGGNSNGPNDDIPWQTQTGKGGRSTGIDTNKLEALLNPNLDTKKMGGASQFQWNKEIRQSSATTAPSNPFAPLSSLLDSKSNDRDLDRDRDRGGLRNKGSYNKNSMERERYGGGMNSRNSSSQGTRENSSSRNNSQGGMRGMMNSSSMQKTTSQSKYTQQQMPSSRLPSKSTAGTSGPAGMYHRGEQPSPAEATTAATPTTYEPPSPSDEKLIKTVITDLLEGAANSKTINSSVVSCFNRIDVSRRPAFLGYILTDYLHLAEVGQTHRRYLSNIVEHLIKNKTITLEHFRLAYNNFCEIANDLIVDIPGLWQYVFEFTGPLIAKNVLTINDLWTKQLIEQNVSSGYSFGKSFLSSFLTYCTREIGPNFTRTLWKNCNLKFADFVSADNVKSFIQSNKFEYVEDETKLPVIDVKDKEKLITRVVERVDIMLKEGSSTDSIIDYINGNILDIDKSFIRNLTTMLCNFAIAYKGDSYKLDNECFQKACIPILQRYIDSVADRELECLTAMQVLVNSLEHPRGLLSELFAELYDTYVIPQESFIKWRDSKDQSAGKGVAVKGLNPFFNHIQSGETSDENNC